MTKVVLHIGRVVVHGASQFDRASFTEALEKEISSRLPADADAIELGRRFGVQRPADEHVRAHDDVVETAARSLAGRLLR